MQTGIAGNNYLPGYFAENFTFWSPRVFGCFDPGNKKCYSGSGTTITDFVSGVTFSTFGNSGDVTFKTEAMGCFELTGNGYIESTNKKYETTNLKSDGRLYDGFALDFWIYCATGHTQEEAILQFGEDDNGTFKNGFTLVRTHGATTTAKRICRISMFDRYGGITASTSRTGFFPEDEWIHVVIGIHYPAGNTTSGFASCVGSVTNSLTNFEINALEFTFLLSSAVPDPIDMTKPKKLTIGKADGITGQLNGKIGLLKVYEGPVFRQYMLPDFTNQDTGEYVLPGFATLNHAAFAKRYGHPETYPKLG
jgi:hypothetical protein